MPCSFQCQSLQLASSFASSVVSMSLGYIVYLVGKPITVHWDDFHGQVSVSLADSSHDD